MRPLVVLTLLVAACAGGGGSAPAPALSFVAGDMRGMGIADGTGAAARFTIPVAVATDGAGNVYVADARSHTIRKITTAGVVTTLAGRAGAFGSIDGAGATACFYEPVGVAADGEGNVYVADSGNHTIRKITPGGVVTTFAGTAGAKGSTDGTGPLARFSGPKGLVVDSAGNVLVSDRANHAIRRITPAGVVTTLAGTAGVKGSADGTAAAAQFNEPAGLAADGAGNLYVSDSVNDTIRKLTPGGMVTTLAGTAGATGSSDGTGAAARFNFPEGLAADRAGNLYVADHLNYTIRKITPAGLVTTLAGTADIRGSTDGTGTAARFFAPEGVAIDAAGNVYVADMFNHAIRKITPAGVVSTFAGTAVVRGSADGTGVAARFAEPVGIAADSAGNVYVADMFNYAIRKVTPAGVVTTLAGAAGVEGSTDGIGAAARFKSPNGIAADGAGNVYVTDAGSIRKITPAGVVTTLPGTVGADATGIATDGAGNVYVADTLRHTIRKITPAGVVSTLAGAEGVSGDIDGTGAAARLNGPVRLATDGAGNVYVTEPSNYTIRRITPAGVVTTLAGTARAKGSTDGIGAAARFGDPDGIATDSEGNVYVADWGNHTIRKITPAGVVSTIVGVAGKPGFVPGALPGQIARPTGVAVSGTSLYITLQNGVAVVRNRP